MKKYLSLLAVLLLLSGLFACGKGDTGESLPPPESGPTGTREAATSSPPSSSANIPQPTPTTKKKEEVISPLFADRCPVAFMINNTPQARPQSGLGSAKLIYQMMTEARTTRFLLLTDTEEGVIGPVRSARPAFLDLAVQHQSFYTYAGNYRVIEASPVKNQIRIMDALKGYYDLFYRTSHRKAPHNLYTRLENCYKRAEKSYGSLELKEGTNDLRVRDHLIVPKNGIPTRQLHYQYNSTKESFQYQPDQKSYIKYNGPDILVDEQTKETLNIANIIVLHRPHGIMPNGVHVKIDWIGQGDAVYLTAGRRYDIQWKKSSHTDPIHYSMNDEELILNPGLTWILVVDDRALGSIEYRN